MNTLMGRPGRVWMVCLLGAALGAATAAQGDENPFQPDIEPLSPFSLRHWVDDTGKSKVEARFVSATHDAVVLQLAAGAKVTVALARLSLLDRGYVEGITAAAALAKPPSPAQRTNAASSPPSSAPASNAPSASSLVGKVPAIEMPTLKPYRGEAKEVALPDTLGDVSLAGGGRWLLLHLPKLKQVAVYDVNEAKVVKYLTLSSESARIVGGLTKMIVVNPSDGVVERWSLTTFKKETTRPAPFGGVFKTMAMGYASEGPLMVLSSQSTDALATCEYKLFDIETFKALPHDPIRAHNSSYRDAVHIRAAATGDVFGLWATSHSPQGMEVMRIIGNSVVTAHQHDSAGHLAPNFDGSAILTGFAGVCTPELNMKGATRKPIPLVPTTHPKFYVSIPTEPGAQINLGDDPYRGVRPTLASLGGDSRLIDLPDFQLGRPTDNASWSASDFTIDKRVYFVVAANQVVTVPFSNDKLIVQPFDWRAQLAEAGIDYLVVTSVPNRIISPGQSFRYSIDVATSEEKTTLELSSGPPGMSIDDSGTLTWEVPPDFQEARTPVIVTVETPDGQSVYEKFELECRRANRDAVR